MVLELDGARIVLYSNPIECIMPTLDRHGAHPAPKHYTPSHCNYCNLTEDLLMKMNGFQSPHLHPVS